MPTQKGKPAILLDVGANVDCKPHHLEQFAIMGDIYSRAIFGIRRPRVGLLSIGEEDTKGNELTKEAFKSLKRAPINFIGNVEGRDIFKGDVDVIVCDGFTGNVALKFSEGLIETFAAMLRQELRRRSPRRSATSSRKMRSAISTRLDYSEYGGAPLLGIKGITIVCHGRSNANAIKNAIRVADEFCKHNVNRVDSKAEFTKAGNHQERQELRMHLDVYENCICISGPGRAIRREWAARSPRNFRPRAPHSMKPMRALDFPISHLCFEGPEEDLKLTENTQPAILTTSIALFRVLEEKGIRPDFVAGHSLGEYSALVAAGALTLSDAVALVRRRGRYMQEAVPVGVGAMAALLGLDLPAVQSVCERAAEGQVVSPANLNSPGQIVIAGNREAVERAVVSRKKPARSARFFCK